MSNQTILLKLFILGSLILHIESIGILSANSGIISENGHDIKATQCGGEIVSDTDSLSYPKSGEAIVPGQVCVWTIHLESLNEFRFNFTNLNISSSANGSEDCSSGGVRIYSLSNLNLEGEELNSYTFCEEIPPTTDFLLGGNVAAIVFYTSSEHNNSTSGFTLNWEGTAIDRMRTIHLSSVSSTPSAEVRYPIIGGYEPNLAATWLIKPDVLETQMDFVLQSIRLESCGIPQEPCSCDALILYEVSEMGIITERQRFCGDSTDHLISGISSNLILGFFTDFESQSNFEGGFDAIYYKSDSNGTTTSIPITTTTEAPTRDTPCGETIIGDQGIIRYKLDETMKTHERCVWTIRAPESTKIIIKLANGSVADGFGDSLYIFGLNKSNIHEPFYESFNLTKQGQSGTVNGNVAVIVLSSYYLVMRNGFELTFEGNHVGHKNHTGQDVILTSEWNITQNFDYPGLFSNLYKSNELSTIVLAPPGFRVDHSVHLNTVFHQEGLVGQECQDFVSIFPFSKYFGFGEPSSFCSDDILNYVLDHYELMVIVFQSSPQSSGGSGFELEWTWTGVCSEAFC